MVENFFDDRTEEDYEEDLESAIDFAIKLIDVDKVPAQNAIEMSAHRFNVESARVKQVVDATI